MCGLVELYYVLGVFNILSTLFESNNRSKFSQSLNYFLNSIIICLLSLLTLTSEGVFHPFLSLWVSLRAKLRPLWGPE